MTGDELDAGAIHQTRDRGIFARGQAYFEKNGGKSVFLGRFLGPVRAIVPVIAGMSNMPPARFYTMNVLSALAWSTAHLLPGVLFGASLQVAGAVSSRRGCLHRGRRGLPARGR